MNWVTQHLSSPFSCSSIYRLLCMEGFAMSPHDISDIDCGHVPFWLQRSAHIPADTCQDTPGVRVEPRHLVR